MLKGKCELKKKIVIFICIIVSINGLVFSTAFAESSIKTEVALCCNDIVYSVDYIYDVFNATNILDVALSDENYTCEWEFDQTESRFYLSISSDTPIAKAETIATVTWTGNDILFLTVPISVQVNGTVNSVAYDYHKMIFMDWIEPGIDNPGYWNGSKCGYCGIIIQEPQEIPPKGPKIKVVLNDKRILTVSGALSDNPIATGTTFLSVYNQDKMMLCVKNITELDQSNFSISLENMKDAHTIKILRWDMPGLRPLHNAVEINPDN